MTGVAGEASTPSLSPLTPEQFPALDGLRGIAILRVLVHQFRLLERPYDLQEYVFVQLNNVGWTDVQFFFLLSGFLITGILFGSQLAESYYFAATLRASQNDRLE